MGKSPPPTLENRGWGPRGKKKKRGEEREKEKGRKRKKGKEGKTKEKKEGKRWKGREKSKLKVFLKY